MACHAICLGLQHTKKGIFKFLCNCLLADLLGFRQMDGLVIDSAPANWILKWRSGLLMMTVAAVPELVPGSDDSLGRVVASRSTLHPTAHVLLVTFC